MNNTHESKAALTGDTLLEEIAQLTHLDDNGKARACGYYFKTSTGPRAHLKNFYQAIAEALGAPPPKPSKSKRNRLSYRVSVQANRTLNLGAAYLDQIGYEPGTNLEIILMPGSDQIVLRPFKPL